MLCHTFGCTEIEIIYFKGKMHLCLLLRKLRYSYLVVRCVYVSAASVFVYHVLLCYLLGDKNLACL